MGPQREVKRRVISFVWHGSLLAFKGMWRAFCPIALWTNTTVFLQVKKTRWAGIAGKLKLTRSFKKKT